MLWITMKPANEPVAAPESDPGIPSNFKNPSNAMVIAQDWKMYDWGKTARAAE